MGGQASPGPSGPLGHPYSPGQPPDKSSSEKACGTIKRREKLARKRVLEDEVMNKVKRTEMTLLDLRTEKLRRRIERVSRRVEEQLVEELVREVEEGGVEGELVWD